MRFPGTRVQPSRALGRGYILQISISLKIIFSYWEKHFITGTHHSQKLASGVPVRQM